MHLYKEPKPVRLSVLLPTRNGGDFLEGCVKSVLSQDHNDLELVVSDNANSDSTPRVLDQFRSDSRLRVIRSEEVLSVTENWNRALSASTGDYLVMLGDDDCLLPGSLSRLNHLVSNFDYPDCITYNGLSFVFPGSLGDDPNGYFADPHFVFGEDLAKPQELSLTLRRSLIRDMFHFRVRLPLNMQLTLFSRDAALNLADHFFRAPFPDHYALNVLLLRARRYILVPEKLAVVGISPKSFGHFFYSNAADAGLTYLGINGNARPRLPGNILLNTMYDWLELLQAELPELNGVAVSHWNYVVRQVNHWGREMEMGRLPLEKAVSRARRLSAAQFTTMWLPLMAWHGWRRLATRRPTSDFPVGAYWKRLQRLEGGKTIWDFAQSWAESANRRHAEQAC